MNPTIKRYVPLVDFLSAVLGNDTEVVLQDLSDGFDHSVVYIKNNISGREIGAPATDFVIEISNNKLYKDKDFVVNYKTKTIDNKVLHSSSFFIKDSDRNLLGLLCINSDRTKMLQLKKLFETSLGDINSLLDIEEEPSATESIIENFYLTADSLIEAEILKETQGRNSGTTVLKKADKIAIVRNLYQKGFFDFKDSVSKLAEAFRMSEISIYKYIQEVKQMEKQ